jgi:hypothetical protein
MEKILEIDLDTKEDLFECYNKKKISKELIQYLIDSTPRLKKNDTLKVVINNRIKGNIRCSELIKKALDDSVEKNEFKFHYNNIKQFSFLIMGIFALVLSSFVKIEVFKEVIIVGAWVLLWDAVEMEIVDDLVNRKKKKILKRLLSSEFIENIL